MVRRLPQVGQRETQVTEINPVTLEHRLTQIEGGLENQLTAMKALTMAVDAWALLQREQNGNVAKIAARQVSHDAVHENAAARRWGMLAVLKAQWQGVTIASAAILWALQSLGVLP